MEMKYLGFNEKEKAAQSGRINKIRDTKKYLN